MVSTQTEGFHSRDLYTKVNHLEGTATHRNNNNSGSKWLFASFLLTTALLCDHTSMQLQTKMSVRCLET